MKPKAFALINNPRLNKGTAFTYAERTEYGLHGLLPPKISTLAEQVDWALTDMRGKAEPIDRYRFMAALQNVMKECITAP